jgi:hypothetical protein
VKLHAFGWEIGIEQQHGVVRWVIADHPTITPLGHVLYEDPHAEHVLVHAAMHTHDGAGALTRGTLLMRGDIEAHHLLTCDGEPVRAVPGDHHPAAHAALRTRVHDEPPEGHELVHHHGRPHGHVHVRHVRALRAALSHLPAELGPEQVRVLSAVILDVARVLEEHAQRAQKAE